MSFDFLNFQDFLRALRPTRRWQVAIELLLIGLFVYWVLRFLRGHARCAACSRASRSS